MIKNHYSGFDYDITKLSKFKDFDTVPLDFTGVCIVDVWICHIENGKTHRKNGPAIKAIDMNNDQCSLYEWSVDGKNHRLDGPCVIFPEENLYFIDDVEILEEKYWQHPKVIEHKLKTILDEISKF